MVEGLVRGYDAVQELWGKGQCGYGLQEPSVSIVAPLHVKPRRSFCYELRPGTDFLRRDQIFMI